MLSGSFIHSSLKENGGTSNMAGRKDGIRDAGGRFGKKHGMRRSSTYTVWMGMKRRCLNQSEPAYPRYGGRGIEICDRWMTFENFLQDMGERPHGKSLDRIDNYGNYEPGNCRWATVREQNTNRAKTIRVDYRGRSLCLSDLCRLVSKPSRRTIFRMFHRGTLNEIFPGIVAYQQEK